MLRITQVHTEAEVVTLSVEGRLIGPTTRELVRACHALLRDGHSIRLDFSEVTFLDQQSIRVLRPLLHQSVEVTKASSLMSDTSSTLVSLLASTTIRATVVSLAALNSIVRSCNTRML